MTVRFSSADRSVPTAAPPSQIWSRHGSAKGKFGNEESGRSRSMDRLSFSIVPQGRNRLKNESAQEHTEQLESSGQGSAAVECRRARSGGRLSSRSRR